jgi:PAS domain-containing protein
MGMSAPRPVIDDRAREALDTLDVPVSVTTAVRDREGRLLDFRVVHVNLAAADWAGLQREAMIGRLATDLIPVMRSAGVFEALERVVATGERFRETGWIEGVVEAGQPFAGAFQLAARRLGDGYVSAWHQLADDGQPVDLEGVLDRTVAAIPMARLEARRTSLRIRPAT